MNKIKYTIKRFFTITALILSVSFASCNDFFDIKPTDIINEDDVWSDPKVILNVLTDLYAKIQWEDFGYFEGFWVFSQMSPSCASDEAFPSWQAGDFGGSNNAQAEYGDEWFYEWPYDQIRNCNVFLQRIEQAPLDESDKKGYEAEVRVIRAFHYFHLVKRFGGVPLVTEPMEYDPSNLDSLQKPREKEETIWNFIRTELDESIPELPESRDSNMKNRVNKYIALAFQSRAMLYAASIAEYGKVELDGLVGIEASANIYWKAAFDASDAVISSKKYSLFKKYDDKSENYQQLFLEPDNGEYIWAKEFILPSVAHDFDKYATAYSFVGGYGCGMAPTLEFVEAFEYINGEEGILKVTGQDGKPIEYAHPLDLFENKDPRLAATVYLPMSPCRGSEVEIRRVMYTKATDSYLKAGDLYETKSLADGTEFRLMGKDGLVDFDDVTKSGFYQKKFVNEKLTNIDFGQSDQPWPVFRLAEMYLNKAEAGFMCGEKEEALKAINEVRERAGIKLLTAGELTMDKIRNERRVELAFENHCFWDLRRWRIAATGSQKGVLDDWEPTALYPYIVYENGNYIFTKANSSEVPKPRKVFYERNYYVKFKAEDMTSNRLLIQNPRY